MQHDYNLIDFFPDCVIPDCPQKEIVHQHIFPKQQDILDSKAKYLYCQGGVGSAKSVAFAVKAVWLSLIVPENVGVVSRKDYKLLYKSSWLDVKKVIKRLVQKHIIPEPVYTDKKQGDYTTITFHNSSVMYAMQGKNWSEGLGASYGWFWVDDAMESYEEMFIGDETSAGILSRLRLPYVHYRKGIHDAEQRPHGMLHGMISTNPPPFGHWLHKLFGTKPGLYTIGNDSVEWIQTATHENPSMGADYATGLMAIQAKMGRSQNVARRVIFGESVPAYGGVKVYPQFDEAKHVGSFPYDSQLPLVCGWDFGFHHPAIIFNNLYRCDFGTNHLISISEIADAMSLTVYALYTEYYLPHIKERYKEAKLILHAGDRAGYRASSSNKDRRGDMKILKDEYKLPFKFRFLDLDNSLQYMRGLLEPKKPCPCGMELICIDQKNCPALIGALQGGYKYSKVRGDGPVSKKPVEDRYFADVACAWRYGAENFVKWGIPYEYQKTDRVAAPALPRPPQGQTPWAWMEMSDADMGKAILH